MITLERFRYSFCDNQNGNSYFFRRNVLRKKNLHLTITLDTTLFVNYLELTSNVDDGRQLLVSEKGLTE